MPKGGNPLFRDPAWQAQAAERRKARRQQQQQPPTPADLSTDEIVAEVDRRIDQHLPDLIDVLITRAIKDGDRQAATYLLDRRLGKITDRAEDRDQDWFKLMEKLARRADTPQ